MKPKLLVLTPRFPFPQIGGDRLRIYQICTQLSAVCDISLLSLCAAQEEMTMPVNENGIFASVHRVYHPLWKRACGVLSVLPTRTPLQIGYYRNNEFSRRLRELAPLHDALLAHLIRTGDYIREFRMPKFLEMTDAISLGYKRISSLRLGSLLHSSAYRLEMSRLGRYERNMIRSFDSVVLVSSVDRDYLTANEDADNVLICPIGVELSALPFDYLPDSRTIVFIGNLTSHQNLDAATYFADAVFPLVRARMPHAVFKVVGRIAPSARRILERHPGVLISGAVHSVPSSVRNASVGICPIRFGAGMQTKLLEYMALGIPAVTSPIGLEGIDAIPDRHLLLANDPQQFAERICWLLEDAERGRPIAVSARALVEQRYSAAVTIAPLREAIERRLKSRRTAA